jgi:hypothetical protein
MPVNSECASNVCVTMKYWDSLGKRAKTGFPDQVETNRTSRQEPSAKFSVCKLLIKHFGKNTSN